MEAEAPSWIQTPLGLALVPEGHHELSRTHRKKFRHAKRYYRALDARFATFQLEEAACHFWHTHTDWNGDGDRSWKDRARHLSAQFVLLRRIEKITATWKIQHQVWLQIYPAGSWEDSIWVHTAGSRDPFPYDFHGVNWLAPIPERLQPFFSDGLHEFGRADSGRTIFYVRAPGIA